MTFRLIEAERAEHAVSRLCKVLGVSRVGFYAWRTRPASAREQRDRELERLIQAVFIDSRETYGAPRVHAELRAQGVRIGKKRRPADAAARARGRLPARQASAHHHA